MRQRWFTITDILAAIVTFGLAVLSFVGAGAQVPGRPITIIVPYSPGTGIDILARALGNERAQKWGQPVVIDNRTGASGNIGTGIAARSAPDGHTVLMTSIRPCSRAFRTIRSRASRR